MRVRGALCAQPTWERTTGKGSTMHAAQGAKDVRSGWTVAKVFLAFLFAVIAGFGLLALTADEAHAKPGQPSDWTYSYSSGDSEVKWGITNARYTNVSNTEATISVDLWTASARTFSASGVGWELWMDGFLVGSGTFRSSNSGGWLNSANTNCTKNTTIKTRSISKYSTQRACTVILAIKYKNGTYNEGYANTIYLPAATKVYVSNGSLSLSPSSPTVGSTITARYTNSSMPTSHTLVYWYRDGVLVKSGVYSTYSSRQYTVTGADRNCTIKCTIMGDTDAYVGSKSATKYISGNITNKSISNGWYWITSSSGKVIDSDQSFMGNVQLYSANKTIAQLWYVSGSSSAGYQFAGANGYRIDVPNSSDSNGRTLWLANPNTANAQKWRIGGSVGSYGQIQTYLSSGRLMGTQNSGTSNFTKLTIQDDTSMTWRLTKANLTPTASISGSGEIGSAISTKLNTVGELDLYASNASLYRVSYQYMRDGVDISGAWGDTTANSGFTGSYTPTEADAGHTISVRWAVRNANGDILGTVTTSGVEIEETYQPPAGSIQNGWYYIKRQSDGKVFNLDAMGAANNTTVHMSEVFKNLECIWYVSANSDGSYTIRNATGNVLDQTGGAEWAANEGYWVKTYAHNGSDAQRWYLTMNSSGQYGNIISKSMSTANGRDWYLSTFDDGVCPCVSTVDKENWAFIPADVKGNLPFPSVVYAPTSGSTTFSIGSATWDLFFEDVDPIYRREYVDITYQIYVGGTVRANGTSATLTSADVGKEIYATATLASSKFGAAISVYTTPKVTIKSASEASSLKEGWYYIEGTSGGVLNTDNLEMATGNSNTGVHVDTSSGRYDLLENLWYAQRNSDGSFSFRNATGNALDQQGGAAGAADEGYWVRAHEYNGTAAQRWYVSGGANELVTISSQSMSGWFLNVATTTPNISQSAKMWKLTPAKVIGESRMPEPAYAPETGTYTVSATRPDWSLFILTVDPIIRAERVETTYRYYVDGVLRSSNSTCAIRPSDVGKELYAEVSLSVKFNNSPIVTVRTNTVTIQKVSADAQLTEGWYYIEDMNSGLVLDADNSTGAYAGANVQLWAGQKYGQQLWYVSGSPSAGYTIVNASGYALDVTDAIDADGTNIQVANYNGSNAQRWNITAPVGAYGIIQSRLPGGRYLAVDSDGTEYGTNVHLWSAASARWRLVRADTSIDVILEGETIAGLPVTGNITGGGWYPRETPYGATYFDVKYEFLRDGKQVVASGYISPSNQAYGKVLSEYKTKNADLNHYLEVRYTITSKYGKVISQQTSANRISILPQGEGVVTAGKALYYTKDSMVETSDGTVPNTYQPIDDPNLCVVSFDRVNGSFRLKNVTTDPYFNTDSYDLVVTVKNQTAQYTGTLPDAHGARTDSVYFAFAKPEIYPSNEEFQAVGEQNKATDTVAMWMKTYYYRTNVTMQLVEAGTNIPANFKLWGRCSDIDIMPGYTMWEDSALGPVPADSVANAYYEGSEFLRMKSAGTIKVAENSLLMQDGANKTVYAPKRAENDKNGSPLFAAMVQASTANGRLDLEYGGTSCGINYNFEAMPTGTKDPLDPQMTITKNADGTTYETGDVVTYTLRTSNRNGDVTTANNVTITDAVPSGLSLIGGSVSAENTNGADGRASADTLGSPKVSTSGNNITITQEALGGDDEIVVTFRARVTKTTNGFITNTAYANCTGGTRVSGSDTITIVGSTVERAALSVTKSVNPTTAEPGGRVSYSILVRNISNITAENVKVTDSLPAGTTAVSTSRGVLSGNNLTYNHGTLAAGSSFTITVTATVNAGTEGQSITNWAYATCSNGSGDNDYASFSVPDKPQLTVSKDADADSYTVGDEVTWTVVVRNDIANTTAEDVEISDLVPDGIEVNEAVATSTGGTPTVVRDGNDVTVTQDALGYGKTITVAIKGTATTAGSFKNTVEATISNGEGDTADDTIVVTEPNKAAITVVKEANGTLFSTGDEIDYRITVSNTSGVDALDVKVTDTLPDNVEAISCDIGTLDGNVWTYEASLMNDGTSFTATIKTKATAPGEDIVNTATATISNGTGGSDDAVVDIVEPALSVEKTADAESYYLNDTVTYTIVVKNTVPNSTAKNVKLTDVLPAELALEKATGTSTDGTANVTTDGNAVNATCDTLRYNEELRVTVTAKAVATGTVENTAKATSDNGKPGEDTETVTVIERTPKLEIAKKADAETYQVGDEIVYTISVTNPVADSVARDVVMTDTLPDITELTDVSATATAGEPAVTKDGNAFTVKLGELAGGETLTVTVKASAVDTGEAVNTATATGNDENGNPVDPVEDTEIVTITPGETTLAVTKTADAENYLPGDAVTYTIAVTNTGESPAMNVTLTDILPVYLKAADTSPATLAGADGAVLKTWDALPENGVYSLDDDSIMLDAGETWTLTIRAIAVEPGFAIVNSVVADSDNSDPAEDDESIDIISPKLDVAKIANVERAQIGDIVEYTITAKNTGTADVVNATITDLMPSNMTWTAPAVLKDGKGAVLASWDNEPEGGVYSPADGIALKPNESIVLTVKATAMAAGLAENTAVATGEDTNGDPVDPAEDKETVPVATPEVTITKTADAGYYQVGDTVTWTITVANNAADTTAHNVVVSDAIPAGIDGATSTIGTIEDSTFTWTIGELPYGVTKTAQISGVATEAAIGNVTNTAKVTHDDGEDDDEVTTPVVNPDKPTLVVDKQADKTDYQVGDTVEYTVKVSNASEASTGTGEFEGAHAWVTVENNNTTGAFLWAHAEGFPADAEIGYQWYLQDGTLLSTAEKYLPWGRGTGEGNGIYLAVIDNSGKYADAVKTGLVTGTTTTGYPYKLTISWKCAACGDTSSTSYGVRFPSKEAADAYVVGEVADYEESDECYECGRVGYTRYTRHSVRQETNESDFYYYDVTNASGIGGVSNSAKNVSVSDLVPDNIEVTNATAVSSNGSPTVVRDGNDVSVSQAELAAGETITITITGTAVAEGDGIVNTATATGEDPDGEPLDPTEDDAVVNVNDANVTITKTADAASYQVGDTITWTVTVENTEAGTTAHNVVVTDTIPDGIENVQASAGSVADGVITWNVGDLAYGAPQTLTVTGVASKAAEGSVTNTATVTHDGGEDDDEVTVDVTDPGLSITKTVDKQTVKIGDVVTYAINMKNTGTAPVHNATITDVMPSNMTWTAPAVLKDVRGATFATWDTEPDGGVYAVENGLTLSPGQEVVLTVKATAAADGTATNVAVGTGEDEGGNPVDPVEDDEIVTVTTPNVTIEKRADTVQYQVGDEITYTISVANTTPGTTATNVVVTDDIPAGIDGAQASAGALVDGTFTWQIGSLPYGQTKTVTITGTVTEAALGQLANTATVTHDDGEDDDEEIVEVIEKTPWTLTKTADKDTYHPGETITWNVTLTRGEAEQGEETSGVHATLYENGAMIFTDGEPTDEQAAQFGEGTAVAGQWNGFENTVFAKLGDAPWYDQRNDVTAVYVVEEIAPTSTAYWFSLARNLTSVDARLLDMSKVTTALGMFEGAGSLATIEGVGDWDVSALQNARDMFGDCNALTSLDVTWNNTGNITNMIAMFYDCDNLKTIDMTGFDTSAVTDFSSLFQECYALTEVRGIEFFDTSKVESFNSLFSTCPALVAVDLSGWNTAKVTDFTNAFMDCTSLNTMDLSGWKTGAADDFGDMFSGCTALTTPGDLGGWDMSGAASLGAMFKDCESLVSIGDISGWNFNDEMRSLRSVFQGCKKLDGIGDLGQWNTKGVTSTYGLFAECEGLTSVGDLSGWDMSHNDLMTMMFYQCKSLESVGDLGAWDVSDTEDFEMMFYGCASLTTLGDLSGWNTSGAVNFERTFQGCAEITDLGDLGGWDVSNVETTHSMFSTCEKLAHVGDLAGWIMPKNVDYGSMFKLCGDLKSVGDLSGWDMSANTDLSDFMRCCYGLATIGDISGWDVSKVTQFDGAFHSCYDLVADCSGWDVSAAQTSSEFNYDADGVIAPQFPASVQTAQAAVSELALTLPLSGAPAARGIETSGAILETAGFEAEPVAMSSGVEDNIEDDGVMTTSGNEPQATANKAGDEYTMSDIMQMEGTTNAQIDGTPMSEVDASWFAEKAGQLAPGESASWKVTAVVTDDAPDTIVNNAAATLADGTELRAESTVNVERDVDLVVDKTADETAYKVGDTIIYTIDAVNEGPDTTINWKVFDALAEGLEFESATVAYKTADNVVNTYSEAAEYYSFPADANPMDYVLEAGDHVYVTIKAKATAAGQISNTARFESLGGDPVEDTVVVTTETPIVEIAKTADKELYKVGETITWTVSVTNAVEGTTATNVIVTDAIPVGVADVTASAGVVENGTFTWQIGDLPYGETKTVTLTGTVTDEAGDTLENTAKVTHDDGEDDDTVIVEVEHPIPSFDVDKTSDADVYSVGDTINYTIIVTNTSEYTAKDVVVTDTMPDSVKPLTTDTGQISGQTVTAVIPEMAPGETVIINVSAEALAAGSVTNTVKVECEGAEPVDDEVTVEVKAPKLDVTKTANVTSVKPGGEVVWTITVTNTVKGTVAHNVVVTDTLPEHFENAKSDGATVNDSTFTWNVGDLAYGETATITITGNVAEDYRGQLVNTAKATCDNGEGDEDDETIDSQKEVTITYIRDVSTALPDGEVVFTETAYEGDEYAVNPEATEKADRDDCYRFDGWFTDPECTKPYTGGELDGDLVLYSKNYAKISFEWTDVAEFPALGDGMYRIPADPPFGYEVDDSLMNKVWEPYKLPLYEQEDGSKASWTECAWGEELDMPSIADPDRATWGGRDWIEWHAKGWFDNDKGTGEPRTEFGGKLSVTGDKTFYADVVKSWYGGSIG